ncbi:MAG: transposase family protein, partial [Desulfobacterales bacterium]|nr:transposase family protein [Desulfobacterales bacterium]
MLLFSNEIDSKKITDWLDTIFGTFGLPKEIISDNGPQFISSWFKNFLAKKSIIHSPTSLYNPQENGKVERFNRNLKNAAQIFSTQDQKSFQTSIMDMVVMFRATSPNDGKSPGELMFGRKIRSSADIRNLEYFARRGYTAEKIAEMTNSAKEFHAKFPRAPTIRSERFPFLLGDFVTTEKPKAQQAKGISTRREPLQITKTIGRYTFGLSDGTNWNIRKLKKFNSDWNLYSDVHVNGIDSEDNLLHRHNLRDRTKIH